MNIERFNVSSVIRSGGHLAVIVSVTLPCLSEEVANAETFNQFYKDISERYLCLAKGLADKRQAERFVKPPIRLSVSFSLEKTQKSKKYLRLYKRYSNGVLVSRFFSLFENEKEFFDTSYDFFDFDSGLFVI